VGLETDHAPPSGVDIKTTRRYILNFNMSSRRDKLNSEMYIYFGTSKLIFYYRFMVKLTFLCKPPA
jgi:hypothetical protein